MSKSIVIERRPDVQYVLRLADTCLIHGQRLAEWCGHAPVLEEDIALANMSLDLIGQARALLTRAGQLAARPGGPAIDEDQLAFLRDERDYFNCTLVELPNGPTRPGDFALTVLRNLIVATLLELLLDRLQTSSDAEMAAIAGKAIKEVRYHRRHAADWVVRLGDGTDESRRRCEAALAELWRYTPELFECDAVDDAAAASGLGPRWSDVQGPWLAAIEAVLGDARLSVPTATQFCSSGKHGVHSEHMGYLLADLQYLQRAYPGGTW